MQILDSTLDAVMTEVVTLGERKGTVKCVPHMLLSAIPKKMPLSGKERGKIIKTYNDSHALSKLYGT